MLSIIAPPISDDNYFYFFDATKPGATYFNSLDLTTNTYVDTANMVFTECVFSYQAAYHNKGTYYHVGDSMYYLNQLTSELYTLYSSQNIDYDTYNLNSTAVISVKNNILFVSGYEICALQLNSSNVAETATLLLWCNEMFGGSTQGVTPSIDDKNDLVFIYDNGYIFAYNQFNGELINKYGQGDIKNECNLKLGCLSSQAIITPFNIIWADGNSVIIIDRQTQDEVLVLEDICSIDNNEAAGYESSSPLIGNSIAWYNEFLVVSCANKIIGYQFEKC